MQTETGRRSWTGSAEVKRNVPAVGGKQRLWSSVTASLLPECRLKGPNCRLVGVSCRGEVDRLCHRVVDVKKQVFIETFRRKQIPFVSVLFLSGTVQIISDN